MSATPSSGPRPPAGTSSLPDACSGTGGGRPCGHRWIVQRLSPACSWTCRSVSQPSRAISPRCQPGRDQREHTPLNSVVLHPVCAVAEATPARVPPEEPNGPVTSDDARRTGWGRGVGRRTDRLVCRVCEGLHSTETSRVHTHMCVYARRMRGVGRTQDSADSAPRTGATHPPPRHRRVGQAPARPRLPPEPPAAR